VTMCRKLSTWTPETTETGNWKNDFFIPWKNGRSRLNCVLVTKYIGKSLDILPSADYRFLLFLSVSLFKLLFVNKCAYIHICKKVCMYVGMHISFVL
jgi:hypothetical protein